MEHNLPKHAQVAISHTGVGITHEEIQLRNMPLPLDYCYIPQTTEEKMISYVDLFYTKVHPSKLLYTRTPEKAKATVTKFGEQNGLIFDEWFTLFE